MGSGTKRSHTLWLKVAKRSESADFNLTLDLCVMARVICNASGLCHRQLANLAFLDVFAIGERSLLEDPLRDRGDSVLDDGGVPESFLDPVRLVGLHPHLLECL